MRINNAECHYAKNQVVSAVCNCYIAIDLLYHSAQQLNALHHFLLSNVEQTDEKLNASNLTNHGAHLGRCMAVNVGGFSKNLQF